MPNLKEHLAISGVASVGTYLFMCNYYKRDIDAGEMFVCAGAGTICGVAPDIFEPAIHPHHRAFGHSVTFGALLARVAMTTCHKENGDWEEFQKVLMAVVVVSYIAHLLSDACTPRRLPII